MGPGGDDRAVGLALLPAPESRSEEAAPDDRDFGDPEAVYRRHGARVSYWAARLAGPGFDIDDIVHDVFLVVLRRLKEFRGDAQVSTWLHEITVRVVQAHRRKRRRRTWLWPFAAGKSFDAAGGGAGSSEPADERLTPLESLERRQATVLLYSFLDQLDEKYRTAVVLFELEGVSCREIATLTGTSLPNVWARVSRGREQLIQAFARWEGRRTA
jgi:RNA polymerase sigma-70 factor, ECF subfamily